MENKSFEEFVSMVLGLIVVIILAVLVFNYFQKRRGSITVPGVSQEKVENKMPTGQEKSAESPTNGKYKVVRGDSLWKIAVAQYGDGFRWVDIQKANDLKDPGSLEVGMELKLPTTEKLVESKNYTVVRGDSLWKIAVAQYGDGFRWIDIWNNNKVILPKPNLIDPGMVLVLPMLK